MDMDGWIGLECVRACVGNAASERRARRREGIYIYSA